MTETTRRDDDTDRGTDAATDDSDRPKLKDVDHTPPGEAADANRVFERGGEVPPVTTDGGDERRSSSPEDDEEPEA